MELENLLHLGKNAQIVMVPTLIINVKFEKWYAPKNFRLNRIFHMEQSDVLNEANIVIMIPTAFITTFTIVSDLINLGR